MNSHHIPKKGRNNSQKKLCKYLFGSSYHKQVHILLITKTNLLLVYYKYQKILFANFEKEFSEFYTICIFNFVSSMISRRKRYSPPNPTAPHQPPTPANPCLSNSAYTCQITSQKTPYNNTYVSRESTSLYDCSFWCLIYFYGIQVFTMSKKAGCFFNFSGSDLLSFLHISRKTETSSGA